MRARGHIPDEIFAAIEIDIAQAEALAVVHSYVFHGLLFVRHIRRQDIGRGHGGFEPVVGNLVEPGEG